MRGIIIRLLLILFIFLISGTWFPQSFLPVWTLILAAHFFSLREGIFTYLGFSVLAVSLEYSWQFFVLLWVGFCVVTISKNYAPNGKIPLVQFMLACLILSILGQYLLYRSSWDNILLTSLTHLLFLGIILFPVKVLGEAYQRYFNALGRNYE